jgi:hypothetical protein
MTNDLQYYFYGCSVISVTKFFTLASSKRDFHAIIKRFLNEKFKIANFTALKYKTILAIRLIYFKSSNVLKLECCSANVHKKINCKKKTLARTVPESDL